ncbi:MAG: hypothetical protein KAW12_09970 [Candidatus Aminicenantes bacterium]|nr:hypothetical protein [Candidatus Aminicenantes bacterium]
MIGTVKNRQCTDEPFVFHDLTENPEKITAISFLANNVYFYIKHAYILKTKKGYRLVVIHDDMIWTDKTFRLLISAKREFCKLYNSKWQTRVKPIWSNSIPAMREPALRLINETYEKQVITKPFKQLTAEERVQPFQTGTREIKI